MTAARRAASAVLASLVTVVLVIGVIAGGRLVAAERDARALAARQEEIAVRGRAVMPFDLDRTTHRFEDLADGGRQTVIADDPDDLLQVTLIRGHLALEAEAFARGDFADPAAIHGHAMPGLSDLKAGASRIAVHYRDVPAGAVLEYSTSEPQLVRAIHAWFDAQAMDHGGHAERG